MDFSDREQEEDDQVDDYLRKRDISLRNYQIQLLEEAQKGNRILYLPTGAGKTLVAVHLLCGKSNEIRRPFSEGGKRAFFLSHTKVLVYQQTKVLQTHTKFNVVAITGDMNVDSWSRRKWEAQFENYQVIVLTGEILRQVLELNFIRPNQVSLIVFDECHHAVSDHPYKMVMQAFEDMDPSEAPTMLGLSAVLLNSSPKRHQALALVQALETAIRGKVITEAHFQESSKFSANPTEKIKSYKVDLNMYARILKLFDNPIDVFNNMYLKADKGTSIPKEGREFKNMNKAKRIKNALGNAKDILEELGMFGGSLGVLFYIIVLEKYRLLSNNPVEIQALIYARTELMKIRHVLLREMGEKESGDLILRYSSHKVQQLIHTVSEVNENWGVKHVSMIVFVQRRSMAVVLAQMFKRLSAVEPRFSFLKPEFAVGSSLLQKESLFMECNNQEVVRRFAGHSLNLVIATNVLEEGVDISACNVVISFDFPLGYPSYFQCKGRARDSKSLYYIFVEEREIAKKIAALKEFKSVEEELKQITMKERETDDDEDDSLSDGEAFLNSLEVIELEGKFGPITVNGITAIKTVERYCMKLPQDKFSLLCPTAWYVNTDAGEKVGFVQLPVNCPLRDVIGGTPKQNQKLAKRAVFMEVVKRLHEIGELDDDLSPKSYTQKEADYNYLFPHFRKENIKSYLPQPGTRKRKQVYKMKFAESLSYCMPQPGRKAYLHVIDLSVAFDKPELQRKITLFEILQMPVTFALISSKKLPKIFEFYLFLDLGKIICNLLVNYDEIVLSEPELDDIKACHFAVFQKVTRILKNSQVFDNRNKEHSFFVAPVMKNEAGRYVLNWDLIRCDFCKNSKSAVVRYNPTTNTNRDRGIHRNLDLVNPTKEESGTIEETCNSLVPFDTINGRLLWSVNQEDTNGKPRFAMTEADYRFFVLIPSYRRQDPPQCYIVNKLCHDMTPLTQFPRDIYEDYCSYYKDKYMLQITNTKQPLLRVTALYNCCNFNKPRTRKARRAREKFKEYEEHLIPELCDVIPFDRRFWVKALLIPTVLNRIYHVYCVQEYLRKVVTETGLGMYELPEGTNWKPLNIDIKCVEEAEDEAGNTASNSGLMGALPLSKLKDRNQSKSKDVLDPERHMYDYSLCDLKSYIKDLLDVNCEDVHLKNNEVIQDWRIIHKIKVPTVNVLNRVRTGPGPDLAMVVQACTSKSANDVVNYDRLEILGDSFLKFATTLFLFRHFPENEGLLTTLKGKMVGNKNLLYCALAKNIPDIINVTDFVPLSDWNPPLLSIPERLVEGIVKNNVDPAVLYRFKIQHEEQFSGVLSEDTYMKNEKILQNFDKCTDMPGNCLLPYKVVDDKTLSDCVEAFIGVYLLTLGVPGAFDYLQWMGVLPKETGSYEKLVNTYYELPLFVPNGKGLIENVLSEVFYTDLEASLNYKFKNRAFLLEAVTHPSYSKNRITNCYQRLELLGDAVLDFLITSYIYESFETLSPGEVTDIRSSLVNNITFACLAVRYEFHKYMLSFSSSLNRAIENFVKYQEERGHVVDENVLVLLEEQDCQIADSLQVPKALGDIFESLAGAIFLDSGNSLETVWNIYYKLMKREIDEFTKTVPKTSIRLLHEICGEPPYYESRTVSGTTKVTCTVYYNNQEVKAHGFGVNKKEGKRSASKLVLNQIMEMKK